jgi:hypothetical protein
MTRRQLLRALGISAGVAPLVPALNGWATPASRPRRLLLVFSGNGMVPERFWPKGGENDFSFPVGNVLEPLEPFRQDLVIWKGLKRKVHKLGGAHERAMGALWTGCRLNPGSQFGGGGWPSGPSVDQIIARGMPRGADFASLEVGGAAVRAGGQGRDHAAHDLRRDPTSRCPPRAARTSCSIVCSGRCRARTRATSSASGPSAAASWTWSTAS